MAETEAERKKKDDLIRETIMAKLIETGEKDKLKGRRNGSFTISVYQCICSSNTTFVNPRSIFALLCAILSRNIDMLHERLIACGWRDELKEYCKEVIRRKGLEKVTVEELVAEITPKGRSSVPEDIKADLLQRIRKFLQATS